MNTVIKLNTNQLLSVLGGKNFWQQNVIGAAAGIKFCRPAGPWAMGACAAIGAGSGAYWGYHS